MPLTRTETEPATNTATDTGTETAPQKSRNGAVSVRPQNPETLNLMHPSAVFLLYRRSSSMGNQMSRRIAADYQD